MVNLVGQLPLHPTKKVSIRKLSDINLVVLHCTDSDIQDPFSYNRYDLGPNHISKDGLSSISYHDMIDREGNVFHTAEYIWKTAHAGAWNGKSVAVALMYSPSKPVDNGTVGPTGVALSSAAQHIANLCMKWKLNPMTSVRGHRELEGTGWIWKKDNKALLKTCPGSKIQLDSFRSLIVRCMQTELMAAGYKLKIDGNFGPVTEIALERYYESLT